MKAISLWQPWATLVAIGAKQYETRSWSTKHRGLLAIQAAKRFDDLQRAYCTQEPFASVLKAHGYSQFNLPFGGIVAVVKVLDVQRTEMISKVIGNNEKAFGNYMPERFAWRLELVTKFDKPIPMNGSQGLFDVADDLIMRFSAAGGG